jgi:hypothetical protein
MKLKYVNIFLTVVLVLTVSGTALAYYNSGHHGSMERQRAHFLEYRQKMVSKMIIDKNYACCLTNPCTYCIEKTPEHGEGATCNCLADVVNGRHPCGECIGEILEGHGNHFLAKFFARAIAEEVGNQYYTPLTGIIEDKYGKPAEEQL